MTRRYASLACDDPAKLAAKMIADVRATIAARPYPEPWHRTGRAPEMWPLTRNGLAPLQLQQHGEIRRWEEGIHRYHLLERLGAALVLSEPSAAERKRQLSDWNERLD